MATLALLSSVLVPLRTPLLHALRHRVPPSPLSLMVDYEAVRADTVAEVADFFVESFWLSSTTFDSVALSEREQSQLRRRMEDDFITRYSSSWTAGGQRLFRSKMLIARENRTSAAIVGCVGFEAALYDAVAGCVLTSAQADVLLRLEIDAMDSAERMHATELHKAGGIAALSQAIFPEYQPIALIANLAVSPSSRGTGIGCQLCSSCEIGCAQWRLPGLVLQVEESNSAARSMYKRLGYEEVHSESMAEALRLRPGRGSLTSALLMTDSENLLESVPSTIVTMAKEVPSQNFD